MALLHRHAEFFALPEGLRVRTLDKVFPYADPDFPLVVSYPEIGVGVLLNKEASDLEWSFDSAEDALNIVQMLIQTGELDIVVVDSVAALTPLAESEGDIGDKHVGLQSRLMSQAMRKLSSIVNETQTILIFINQAGGQ